MEKYILGLAILGVSVYLYMDMPREMQPATQYEIVKLHNPLLPLPAKDISSDLGIKNEARILLVSSPIKGVSIP